jgi:hypothetical protein
MHQTIVGIIKWASIPVLLIAAMLSCFAASYEPLLDSAILAGALFLLLRAVRLQEYFWAAGFVAIVILFCPIFLAVKIFLLMGFACIGACITLFAAFRAQPLPVTELP